MGRPIGDRNQSERGVVRLRRHRRFICSLIAVIAASLLLPLLLRPVLQIPAAQAAFVGNTNQRANFWRAVREGRSGFTAVQGAERGVLIQNGGENWRHIRNGWVSWITPWMVGLMLAAIIAFYLYRGRIRVEKPLSGRKVDRWSMVERFLHWYTAILFIVLAVTGASLLFGRAVLIPIMGRQSFGAYAQYCKDLHNYIGPLFTIGVAVMIFLWLKDNIPRQSDLEWIRKKGGMMKHGEHASAGRMNGGEKLWFWFMATFGVLVIASGFVMDFPNFGQSRNVMQIANVVHSVLAMAWLALSLGHIYIGTLGTEGALEGMVTGKVSEEWAEQHHDRWLARQRDKQGGQEAGTGTAQIPG